MLYEKWEIHPTHQERDPLDRCLRRPLVKLIFGARLAGCFSMHSRYIAFPIASPIRE
jgi:hypothetical protein